MRVVAQVAVSLSVLWMLPALAANLNIFGVLIWIFIVVPSAFEVIKGL